MNIYLYVKTHTITGLKYLGKTTRDPFNYNGSGVDWKTHLKEHGEEHTTEIIKVCKSKKELNEWGRYYSKLWNVAESKDWANRIPETGGGWCTPESNQKRSKSLTGLKRPPRTEEHTEKIAQQFRGKPNPKTAKGLRKYYDSNPDRSHTIKKQSESLKKWYNKNPVLSHKKTLKTWEGRYKKDYEKYKTVISCIAQGKRNREIQKIIKVDCSTINKLRSGTHRLFSIFPEFVQLLRG